MMMYLIEEKPLKAMSDESLWEPAFQQADPATPDWGTDPMEILMAKQELESKV